MKIYIAGKITDCKDFKKQFKKAEKLLRKAGNLTINPAKNNYTMPNFAHEDYMHVCKAMIDVCEAVAFLPNWTESKGAKIEHDYAKKIGKEIIYMEELKERLKE